MTTTGPFEASGMAAGVSVEGPIASVSARVRLVGSAGFTEDVVGADVVSDVYGTAVSVWAVEVVSGTWAVFVVADTALDGGNVLISTGLDDSSSCVLSLSVRDPTIGCCGLPCAAAGGWSAPVDAIAGRGTPSQRRKRR